MKDNRWACSCLLAASSLLFMLGLPGIVWGKWYILTGVHTNTVQVIDTDTDKIVKEIPLEGRGPLWTVVPNPAYPQFAYAVTNLNQSVAIVDIDEGKEVSRFNLSSDSELVRTTAIDVNAKGDRLYIYELPLKKDLGRYEMQKTRIRVIDLNRNEVIKVFSAPRQVMAMASSQDGKRLYAFGVGRDVYVLDPERGELIDTIPLFDRNLTGEGSVQGLPLWTQYQENDYFVSFAVVVSDTITGNTTLGIASMDLTQEVSDIQVVELQPFAADSWTVSGVASPKTKKAYFGWSDLWKVDIETRRIEKTVPLLDNTHFAPFLRPDGKKVYCGGNWNAISVFDAETLEPITKIELGHPQAGTGIRFVQR